MIEIAAADASAPDAQWAMGEYFAELARRIGFADDRALERAVDDYRPPHGGFFLARLGETVVGCVAVVGLDHARAEVKRMWVSPGARGHGLGRRLLDAVEGWASERAFASMVLDTSATLVEAVALYDRSGYERVPPYNDNPDAELWFEKRL